MGNETGISYAQPTDDEDASNTDAVLDIQQSVALADESFVDFDWAMSLNMNDWPM